MKALPVLILLLNSFNSIAYVTNSFIYTQKTTIPESKIFRLIMSPISSGTQPNQKLTDRKEESRKLRRTVFTKNDWKRHRSSDRYFKELKNMPKSIVIRGLIKQALWVALFSAFIVAYNLIVELKILSWPLPLLSIPSQPFSLTSPSLGLLLVFRTNAAYARWTEGRSAWSILSAASFDLIRQSITWMDNKTIIAGLTRHTVAFSKCLSWQLLHKEDNYRLRKDLVGIMTSNELENVLKSKNKCQFILIRMTQLIKQQNMAISVQSHMDKGLIKLSNAMEICERIFTTPIPLVYTRHTARFLLLWLLTVPMSLYNEFTLGKKWIVPLISFLNSIFLFGIEDLGVQIEEPFTILPLANICYNIQNSAQNILIDNDISWFHGTEEEVINENPHVSNINLSEDIDNMLLKVKIEDRLMQL